MAQQNVLRRKSMGFTYEIVRFHFMFRLRVCVCVKMKMLPEQQLLGKSRFIATAAVYAMHVCMFVHIFKQQHSARLQMRSN